MYLRINIIKLHIRGVLGFWGFGVLGQLSSDQVHAIQLKFIDMGNEEENYTSYLGVRFYPEDSKIFA